MAAAALLLTAPQAFAGRAVTTRPGLLASPTLGLPATAAALAPAYASQSFELHATTDPHPAAFALFDDLAPPPLELEKLASGVESWELTPNLQRIQQFVAETWWVREHLGPVDSPNLYQAFGLDPQNNTDPMGECIFGIGGTCAEWADKVAGAFEAAKKKVRKHTDGSVVGVLIDYGVSTNLDLIETFFVDPFRAGDAIGQAVGEGAGAGTVALAAVQDAGRVAALAAGAGAAAKAGGRAARAMRGATELDDASGAAAKALREGSLDTSSYLDNYARDFKAPEPVTAPSPVGSAAPRGGNLAGSQLSRDVRGYLNAVEQNTGFRLHPSQRTLLAEELRTTSYSRLSSQAGRVHRRAFTQSVREAAITEWEKQTGQLWPRYAQDVLSAEGNVLRRAGQPFDAHHVIENIYGGPHTWWNLTPARFPAAHQGGIHLEAILQRLFP